MTRLSRMSLAATGLLAALIGPVCADTIKVGVIGQFSGPFAQVGKEQRDAFDVYIAQHGAKVGTHDLEFIFKDIGGPNPAVAKSLVEQLIVKDGVSIITGFQLSTEAAAAAPVLNETKVPGVLSISAAPQLLRMSPYFVRAGQNIWQPAYVQADFAIDNGKKRAYIAVADYTPGHEVQEAFKRRFEELGGEVVGQDRIPLNTVDFAAFAERIANTQPDVVIQFVPNGAPAVGFTNALVARGVNKSTMIIGVAEADDPYLPQFGPEIEGTYSANIYAGDLDNPENVAFRKAWADKFGADSPIGLNSVTAYDAMQLIYRMVEAQNGAGFDSEKAMAAVKGYSFASPGGPKLIDAATRELFQNVYIRQVRNVDGKLVNVRVKTYEGVKNPWAEAHPE